MLKDEHHNDNEEPPALPAVAAQHPLPIFDHLQAVPAVNALLAAPNPTSAREPATKRAKHRQSEFRSEDAHHALHDQILDKAPSRGAQKHKKRERETAAQQDSDSSQANANLLQPQVDAQQATRALPFERQQRILSPGTKSTDATISTQQRRKARHAAAEAKVAFFAAEAPDYDMHFYGNHGQPTTSHNAPQTSAKQSPFEFAAGHSNASESQAAPFASPPAAGRKSFQVDSASGAAFRSAASSFSSYISPATSRQGSGGSAASLTAIPSLGLQQLQTASNKQPPGKSRLAQESQDRADGDFKQQQAAIVSQSSKTDNLQTDAAQLPPIKTTYLHTAEGSPLMPVTAAKRLDMGSFPQLSTPAQGTSSPKTSQTGAGTSNDHDAYLPQSKAEHTKAKQPCKGGPAMSLSTQCS